MIICFVFAWRPACSYRLYRGTLGLRHRSVVGVEMILIEALAADPRRIFGNLVGRYHVGFARHRNDRLAVGDLAPTLQTPVGALVRRPAVDILDFSVVGPAPIGLRKQRIAGSSEHVPRHLSSGRGVVAARRDPEGKVRRTRGGGAGTNGLAEKFGERLERRFVPIVVGA